MRSLITPFITRRWSSDAYHQRLANAALKSEPTDLAQVFISFNDPYSYLLLKGLETIQTHNHIRFDIHLIQNPQADMFPEPKMWSEWAKQDAEHLASLYQFPLPAPLAEADIIEATRYFMHARPLSISEALALFEQDVTENSKLSSQDIEQYHQPDIEQFLASEEQHLLDLGHYLPATVYYMGEFFWGLDRISHFEARLLQYDRAKVGHTSPIFTKSYEDFCRAPKHRIQDHDTPVELYFSMRSPYSHLALHRCYQLCQHYYIPLVIKPVLPMLMRGLSVPKNKTQYIFFDTLRESKKLGIQYGNVADPLGQGVRNCYALWMLANEKQLGNEFMLAFSHAVNAKGITGNYHFGLKKICREVGLDWNEAKHALKRTDWLPVVEDNIRAMYDKGFWGVPTIAYGSTWVWGQDRIWKIEQTLLANAKQKANA